MVRICFLGTVQVFRNENRIPPFSTQKAASLFAYLVMNSGKAIYRESLANLFWPDRPEVNGRRSLHTALWQIRNTLKSVHVPVEQYLFTTNNTVTWVKHSDDWLDVEVFESLYNSPDIEERKNAIRLYQGNLLNHLNDDWCLEGRTMLEIHYMEALKSLIESCFAVEDFSGAVEYAQRMIAVDPLNEDANRGMMYALHQLGNRSGVIQHYKGFSNLLREELGILPSEQTCRIYQQIIDGQIPLHAIKIQSTGSTTQAALQTEETETTPAPTISPNLDLFEREIFANRKQEMQALNGWWSRKTEIVAQIKGCQGSGKTRLMQEFSTILKSQGTLVGWGRCFTFSQGLTYQVISDVLRSLLVCTPKSLREKIPGQIIRSLMSICPDLGDILDMPVSVWEGTAVQSHPFYAFSDLLTYLAQFFPILLVIDDLNWVDNSTQQMLEYLVRHLQNSQSNGRCAIRILTALISDVGQPAYIVLMNAHLLRDGVLQELSLQNLDYAAVEQWLTSWYGSMEQTAVLADHLYRQTGGNPFLIIETMKAVLHSDDLRLTSKGWEGTALDLGLFPVAGSIHALIEDRMNRLSPFALQVLLAASVVGPSFSLNTVRQMLDVSEVMMLQALDELLRLNLIQEPQNEDCSGYDFTFTHQLIHLAIYNRVDKARRAIFQRRLQSECELTSPVWGLGHSKSQSEQELPLSRKDERVVIAKAGE